MIAQDHEHEPGTQFGTIDYADGRHSELRICQHCPVALTRYDDEADYQTVAERIARNERAALATSPRGR